MTKSEAQTRSELIDQQLAQSSRNVKDPTQDVEEFDILTALPEGVAETRTPYEGHQFSDYALLGKHRKPPAVVEAKKTSRDAAIGRYVKLYIAATMHSLKLCAGSIDRKSTRQSCHGSLRGSAV